MNVLLVYGGKSVEHDVSIITGCFARSFFSNHKLFCCYIDQSGKAFLVDSKLNALAHKTTTRKKPLAFEMGNNSIFIKKGVFVKKIATIDCVINCCHGSNGEDGSLSGVFQLCNFSQAQSSVFASSLTMNKQATKQILQKNGFNVVDGALLKSKDKLGDFEYPLVVKPVDLGSSIGVRRVENRTELKDGLREIFKMCEYALVEKAIDNFVEVNCSALLEKGEIRTSALQYVNSNKVLTFGEKYESEGAAFSCEKLSCEQENEIKEQTKKIYELLNLSGVIRIDFFVCDGEIFVNEVNTTPGNLAYHLWQNEFTKKQFGNLLIENALLNKAVNEKLQRDFQSGVLESVKKKKYS